MSSLDEHTLSSDWQSFITGQHSQKTGNAKFPIWHILVTEASWRYKNSLKFHWRQDFSLLVFSSAFQFFLAVLKNSSFWSSTSSKCLFKLCTEKFLKLPHIWAGKNIKVWRFENFSGYISDFHNTRALSSLCFFHSVIQSLCYVLNVTKKKGLNIKTY